LGSNDASFSGEIKVAARIIDHISSGLYESPAACLKELINNSYDADAKKVDVFVKPDANQILIADDGIGLNKDEFQRHFDRISESHKRETSDVTKYGRLKIGKIGIGFIAANEICDVMEIESTKQGSDELLKVTINDSPEITRYFQPTF
jgi:HSP90 family molecular chaperone